MNEVSDDDQPQPRPQRPPAHLGGTIRLTQEPLRPAPIGGKVLRAAFVHSLPVMMGYLAMGMAAGILLAKQVDVPWRPLYAALTSGVCISGALQFLLVDWVKNSTAIADVVLLTLCLNLRYAMYGFSLLERFVGVPWWKKCYLVWTLTDETYAIEVANKVPPGGDPIAYCLAVAAFDHLYWIVGVTAGAVVGAELPFNCQGIDFAMTALFLVILVDQLRERVNRWPALIGVAAALGARCFFPTGKMLLPTIPLMLVVLLALRRRLLALEEPPAPTDDAAADAAAPAPDAPRPGGRP